MLIKDRKICFYMVFCIIGTLLALMFNSIVINDEMEHLRMSWLVSQGEVPYRDFFEHHHPLLWYLFAPIIVALPHNILWSFYVAKVLSLVCVLVTYYIIYLIIRRFLGGAHLAVYFFIILFSFYPIWYGSSLFKPDAFSRLFYFLGIYLFFCYMETTRLKDLSYCAISFTISFLFLQTIVMSVLPLVIPMGIHLYKNPRKIRDCILASIVPFIIIAGGVCWLVYTNMWQEYYQLNWILNTETLPVLDYSRTKIYEFMVPLFIASGIIIYRYQKKLLSDYEKIIGLLFVTELIQHIYVPAIYYHYLMLLLIFTAMVIFPILGQIFVNPKLKQVKSYIYIFLFAMLCANFSMLYIYNNYNLWYGFKKINASKTDMVVNIYAAYFPVYTKKNTYYGLYNSIHRFDDKLFHRLPEYDVNEIIEKYKPKYITYNIRATQQKQKTGRFTLREEMLEKYQEIAPELWQRIDVSE